jgi:hypothetical protein
MTRNKRKLQKTLTKAELKDSKEKKQRNRKNKLKNCSLLHVSFHSFLEIQHVMSEIDK